MEDILDNETKETHADIANAAEAALDDPKKQERWKAKYQVSITYKGKDVLTAGVSKTFSVARGLSFSKRGLMCLFSWSPIV